MLMLTLTVNGAPETAPPGTTVADIVSRLKRSSDGIAVAVNDSVVTRSRWGETVLSDGDRVELLTAAQGG